MNRRTAIGAGQWVMTFRTGYSGIEVRQMIDLRNAYGDVVEPAGALPTLRFGDVILPGYGGQLLSHGEETRGMYIFSDRNVLAWCRSERGHGRASPAASDHPRRCLPRPLS